MKAMLHECTEFGWSLKPIMRKGAVIKVTVAINDLRIELRDSMKKVETDLKSLGKLVGLDK